MMKTKQGTPDYKNSLVYVYCTTDDREIIRELSSIAKLNMTEMFHRILTTYLQNPPSLESNVNMYVQKPDRVMLTALALRTKKRKYEILHELIEREYNARPIEVPEFVECMGNAFDGARKQFDEQKLKDGLDEFKDILGFFTIKPVQTQTVQTEEDSDCNWVESVKRKFRGKPS